MLKSEKIQLDIDVIDKQKDLCAAQELARQARFDEQKSRLQELKDLAIAEEKND